MRVCNKVHSYIREALKKGKIHSCFMVYGEHEITLVLVEFHQGACDNYIWGWALTHKLLRVDYYLSSLMRDILAFVKRYYIFQRHTNLHHVPAKLLHIILVPWPIYLRGIDTLGSFPICQGQLNFMVVGINYFLLWIKEGVMSKITVERVVRFYWQKTMCRFNLLGIIILDNGLNFLILPWSIFTRVYEYKQSSYSRSPTSKRVRKINKESDIEGGQEEVWWC